MLVPEGLVLLLVGDLREGLEGLASRRYPLRSHSNRLLLRRRPRSHRHLL